MAFKMDNDIQFDETMDARSSFDIQLPIQIHSRPISRMSGDLLSDANDATTQDKTETNGEQELIKQAYNLGLKIPDLPKEYPEPVNLITHNASAVTVTSSRPDSSVIQSRASNSTRPTSFSSSERHAEQRKVSPPSTVASIASPSLPSVTPRPRPDSKFRKSIRRLSILSWKKTPDPPEVFRPPLQRQNTPVSTHPRPATADGNRFRSSSSPPVLPPISTVSRRTVGTLLPSFSEPRITTTGRIMTNSLRPLTPPSEEKEFDSIDTPSTLAAKKRSLHCGRLQRLRIAHLDEQSSFLNERRAAFSGIRAKYDSVRKGALDTFVEKRTAALSRHAIANSDLENRHLTAEMDLERALTFERKATETKIKYMEAYCYGSRNRNLTDAPPTPAEATTANKPPAVDMPPRKVTEEDYRKLVEQYHLRNGMDQLHAARINVLREQQAKQAERIGRKQERELEVLEEERDRELAKVENEVQAEMSPARREWEVKKRRMMWRWAVKEAIERKTLEAERGESYGELPDVVWAAEHDDEIYRGESIPEEPHLELEVRSMGDVEIEPMGFEVGKGGEISVNA